MELGRASAIVCLNLINFLSKSVVNILYSVFYICASVHLQTQVRMLVESVCNGTRVGVCQHANLCDAVFSVSFWQWWSDLDSEPDIHIYVFIYKSLYINIYALCSACIPIMWLWVIGGILVTTAVAHFKIRTDVHNLDLLINIIFPWNSCELSKGKATISILANNLHTTSLIITLKEIVSVVRFKTLATRP